MADLVIPMDNEKTSKVDHPWVSERERLKNIAALFQQVLIVLECSFVAQTKDLFEDHPHIYGDIYLGVVLTYTTIFVITILQPPYNASRVQFGFLMTSIAISMSKIACLITTWVGIASSLIWVGGILHVFNLGRRVTRYNNTRYSTNV
jgi:hypothetical protein